MTQLALQYAALVCQELPEVRLSGDFFLSLLSPPPTSYTHTHAYASPTHTHTFFFFLVSLAPANPPLRSHQSRQMVEQYVDLIEGMQYHNDRVCPSSAI